MTSAEISSLLTDYERSIENAFKAHTIDAATADHLKSMVVRMRDMNPNIDEALGKERITLMKNFFKQREKLMRWLGFMQGVFWAEGVYDLNELQNHNITGQVGVRPREEPEFGS